MAIGGKEVVFLTVKLPIIYSPVNSPTVLFMQVTPESLKKKKKDIKQEGTYQEGVQKYQ